MKFSFGKNKSSGDTTSSSDSTEEVPADVFAENEDQTLKGKKKSALKKWGRKKNETVSNSPLASEPPIAAEDSPTTDGPPGDEPVGDGEKGKLRGFRRAQKIKSPKTPKEPKPKKEKKVKKNFTKPRKPSFARKARFTLLIGDEGAILIHMKGSRVLSRQFVPDASEANLEELRETIDKDPLAPIMLIIDSMDQAFVQQTLPPVSRLSVDKLIKRRLDRDFKPDDIKGAILLGKEKEGRKDWSFLMISVDKSPQITLWLDFIMSFENRFRGIVLLSVEAEIFIRNLDRAIGGVRPTKPAVWKFIVSHNKVGGFRQIVLKNGRLIFTRLAQPVGEPTAEVIAGNIEQEMSTTIEYLRRFGYDATKGLDIYIIAAESIVKLLDTSRFDPQSSFVMTPYQVSTHLGIDGATQPTDQYGDVILASAIGGSRRNVMKLTTVESRQYDAMQRIKYGQRLLGTFMILGLIVYGAYLGYNSLLLNSDIEDLEQKQKIQERALEQAKQRVVESKLDIEAVTDRIELHRMTKAERRDPLPTLTLVASTIRPPLVMTGFKVELGDNIVWPSGVTPPPLRPTNDPNNPIQKVAEPVTVTINVDYPAGLKTPSMFRKFSSDILGDIRDALPEYTVLLSETPRDYLESNNLQITFDKEAAAASTVGDDPFPMKIYIYGPLVTSIKGVEER